MKTSSKKGLFLSIELIIVLFVIIALLMIIFVGSTLLISSSKQTKIVNEMEANMAAIINFRSQLGYWPGDIPYDILNKTPGFIGSNIATATQATQTSANCVKNAYGSGEVGLVYGYKSDGSFDGSMVEGGNRNGGSYLAFAQLIQGGYLKGLDLDLSSTSRCIDKWDYDAVITNKYYPKARFDSKLAWVFNVFKSDQNRARFGYVTETYSGATVTPSTSQNGTGLFPVAFNAYRTYWNQYYREQPLLTLFRYSDVVSVTASISSYLNSDEGMGALSPELIRAIDKKIDDGKPFGLDSSSNIKGRVTVNHGNWVDGGGCFTKKDGTAIGAQGVAATAFTQITTLTTQDWLDAEYKDSKLDNGLMGCIVVFRGISPENG